MNAQNYKNLCPKAFDFFLNFKNAQKILLNQQTFLYMYKGNMVI